MVIKWNNGLFRKKTLQFQLKYFWSYLAFHNRTFSDYKSIITVHGLFEGILGWF